MNKSKKIFKFTNQEENRRLDKALRDVLLLQQSIICRSIRSGLITINNKKASSHSIRLIKGDIVETKFVEEGKIEKYNSFYECIPLSKIKEIKKSIILENQSFVVINKPFGIATQSGGGLKFSLDGIMRKLYSGESKIVHRLDKDTSGLIVVARSKEMAQKLSLAFKNSEVQKVYLAVVEGIQNQQEGELKSLIGRFPNTTIQRYTTKVRDGRVAITQYKVIKVDIERNISMLELKPVTGRTHQLRVHCAELLGMPIVGDFRYGANVDLNRKLHLLSHKIKLPDEIHKEWITVPRIPEFFIL